MEKTIKQIVVLLNLEEYTKVDYIASSLNISIPEWFRRSIPQIDIPESVVVSQEDVITAKSSDFVKIRENVKIDDVRAFLDQLRSTNYAKALEKELRNQIISMTQTGLKVSTYERLGRWCHPKRWTDREQTVKEIAEKISIAIFSKVIDRIR